MKKTPTSILSSLILCFFVLSLITFYSCEKDNLLSPQNQPSDGAQILPRDGVSDPSLASAGYLLFDDRAHLTNYYLYLETVADTASDISNALLTVISRLGHQSLFYSDTAAFANPSALDLTDASISDPLRKVILNSKYEVGIGDSLFVFQNRWQTYSFPLTDTEARDSLFATPKGTKMAYEKYTNSIRLVNSEEQVIVNRSPFCVQYLKIKRESPCEDPFEVKVNAASFAILFPLNFTMDIDWDDGDTTEDNFNSGNESFTHVYASSGTFTIVAELNTSCIGPIVLTAVADVIVGGDCDPNKQHDSEWSASGNIGMSSEIWVANDPFGTHSGARTTLYEFVNAKWRERPGNVSAFIDSDFRDQNCEVNQQDDETDQCGNCKSKKATVAASVGNRLHFEGDVVSSHSATRNNVTLTNELVLVFCD